MRKFLTSIRLAIALILIIIVLCIIATLLPQNQLPIFYANYYGQAMAQIITTLRLDKVYTSPWMYGAGALLGLNLISCTVLRLRWAIRNHHKHHLQPLGSPILHLGLCLVLIGTTLSLLFGQNNYYEIPVGESITITEGRTPFSLTVCDFSIDYYEDGQTPQQYRSQLSADDGQNPQDFEVAVNHPQSYRGVKFYQNSYGWIIDMAQSDGFTRQLYEQQWYPLDEVGDNKISVRFFPDYVADASGHPATVSPKPNNPYLLCMITQSDKLYAAELLRPGQSMLLPNAQTITFGGFRYYTGLQVKYDRAILLIFLAFIFISAGLIIRFFPQNSRPQQEQNPNISAKV